jgi:hypothetical protein
MGSNALATRVARAGVTEIVRHPESMAAFS